MEGKRSIGRRRRRRSMMNDFAIPHRLPLRCFSRPLSALITESSTLPIVRGRFRGEAAGSGGRRAASIIITQPPPLEAGPLQRAKEKKKTRRLTGVGLPDLGRLRRVEPQGPLAHTQDGRRQAALELEGGHGLVLREKKKQKNEAKCESKERLRRRKGGKKRSLARLFTLSASPFDAAALPLFQLSSFGHSRKERR